MDVLRKEQKYACMYGFVREIELHETIVQWSVTARRQQWVGRERKGIEERGKRGTEPYGVIILLKLR